MGPESERRIRERESNVAECTEMLIYFLKREVIYLELKDRSYPLPPGPSLKGNPLFASDYLVFMKLLLLRT